MLNLAKTPFVVYGIYMNVWSEPISFQWDSGNSHKNSKHQVNNAEIEEIFFDPHKVMAADHKHSQVEQRYVLLGKTYHQRLLYAVFTVREGIVRIISARDVNKKEVHLYEKTT